MAFGSADPILFTGVSAVTSSRGANDPEIGTRARFSDGREYLYVYNAGNSQVSPGYGVTVSATSGYSVTVSSTTSADLFVGVVRHSTLTTGTYGWVVCQGPTEVKMGANNSAAAGVMLTPGTDGVFAAVSAATANLGVVVGKTAEAIASGASGTAWLRCFV
jgi:hypothetical protein